jgi:hypothetical protein
MERGNTGFHTEFGDRKVSVYREEDIIPSAENWSEVYHWIMQDVIEEIIHCAKIPPKYHEPVRTAFRTLEPERFELLEKRIKKGTVKEHMEATATYSEETGLKVLGSPPPGVRVLREFSAQVRLLPTK